MTQRAKEMLELADDIREYGAALKLGKKDYLLIEAALRRAAQADAPGGDELAETKRRLAFMEERYGKIAWGSTVGEVEPRAWPVGCQDSSSCFNHRECMYVGCEHHGTDIVSAVTRPLLGAGASMIDNMTAEQVADWSDDGNCNAGKTAFARPDGGGEQ